MRTVKRFNRKADPDTPRHEARCVQLVEAGWRGEYQPNYVKLPPGTTTWQAQLPRRTVFDNNNEPAKNTLTFGVWRRFNSMMVVGLQHQHPSQPGTYFTPYLAVLAQALLLKRRKTYVDPQGIVDKAALTQHMLEHVNDLAETHGEVLGSAGCCNDSNKSNTTTNAHKTCFQGWSMWPVSMDSPTMRPS